MTYNGFHLDPLEFDAVWQRVTAENARSAAGGPCYSPAAKAPDGQFDMLRDFIDDAARDAALYRTLAGMCSGCARRTLCDIAGIECRHLRRLKTACFILTGQTYTPPESCPLVCSVRDTLREKYCAALAAADDYGRAAEGAPRQDLADTYRTLGAEKAHIAERLACILESIL